MVTSLVKDRVEVVMQEQLCTRIVVGGQWEKASEGSLNCNNKAPSLLTSH